MTWDPKERQPVGGNDLRATCDGVEGFAHVVLEDADDGDKIVVNEDDVIALRDYFNRVIQTYGL